MPEWLRTALIVLAVLAALYLIAVVVQIVLAKLLRRQAEPMHASIQKAKREVADVAGKLEAIAPAINGGPREMPFGPLYDQARLLLKRGMANVNEVREQLAAITARTIPEKPWSEAFKLVPMTTEIVRRWQTRRGVKTVSVHLTEVNDTLARIKQLQADIATIPQREKDALLQLQKRVAEAAAMLENETRPKRPLVEEHSLLKEVSARVEQVDKLLASPEPPQSAIIAAYLLRMRASEELQSLDKMIAAAVEQRTGAEAALAKSSEQLSAFKSSIAADEQAGYVRARFAAAAGQLAERIAAVRARVEQGDYELAMGALADVDKDLAMQRDALAALNQERERVAGLVTQAEQWLGTVRGWIAETPARFERDVAGAAANQLQTLVEQLRALIPLEEIERMAEAAELDRQVEDAFTRAGQANDAFVAARTRFEALVGKLNEENMQSLTASAVRVASELGGVNRNYWGDLTPEVVTAAAESAAAQWHAIRDRLGAIKESALSEVLAQLEGVAELFDRASALRDQATQALAQRDADKLRASTALNDDAMAKLLAGIAQIAAESPSLAELPARIQERVEVLRGELQTPAPDYRRICTDADQLRKEAEAFAANYRQQLQQVRGQLGLLKYRLEEAQGNLNRLREDPRIDFAALVEPASAAIREWLSGYEAAVAAPLDAAREALAAGEGVERDAIAQLSSATTIAKSIGDKLAPTKIALAELKGVLSSAQSGLHEMGNIGGERWGQTMLAPICERLDDMLDRLGRLEQPAQKFTPEGAQQAMAHIEAMVKEVREQATTAHADIARRVAEVRERRTQLSQALADGDALVAANPALEEEWRLVRQQVSGLELRWTNATSYAEGLDAMTQAIQRVQRFIERGPANR
ncbi:MAG: hypothetical protein RMN52_13575 [Anaerolineae bacterium]|nr:hypothetical protein [Candidatus Roseilinea sp.]MDW8451023.1 hypothetical protein [Anaerolineae bacterium]